MLSNAGRTEALTRESCNTECVKSFDWEEEISARLDKRESCNTERVGPRVGEEECDTERVES